MASFFLRTTIATSLTLALTAIAALAEEFSVTFEGRIVEIEETELKAPPSIQEGAEYRYIIKFITSGKALQVNEQTRDLSSIVSGELVVGDFSTAIQSEGYLSGVNVYVSVEGSDDLSVGHESTSDTFEELSISFLGAGFRGLDIANDGDSLKDMFQALSKVSDFGPEAVLRFGFEGEGERDHFRDTIPEVSVQASIEGVSYFAIGSEKLDLKAPILSDDEIAKLGSGLLNCLRDDQIGWERTHADRTRNEDFLVALSPIFIEEIEQRALESSATYRVISVGYERKTEPFLNDAYFLILENAQGNVMVTPEYRQMGGTEYEKLDGEPCLPGAWGHPIEAFMVEKPKGQQEENQAKEDFEIPNGQSVRADLVGTWQCEGQGKAENKGVVEKWSSSTVLDLQPDGKFQRSMSFTQGDDNFQAKSQGHWYADDKSATMAVSLQNVDHLVVDGEEVPKLLLGLASLADGMLGTNKEQVFDVKKRGLLRSRLTLQERGDLPATCERLDS